MDLGKDVGPCPTGMEKKCKSKTRADLKYQQLFVYFSNISNHKEKKILSLSVETERRKLKTNIISFLLSL